MSEPELSFPMEFEREPEGWPWALHVLSDFFGLVGMFALVTTGAWLFQGPPPGLVHLAQAVRAPWPAQTVAVSGVGASLVLVVLPLVRRLLEARRYGRCAVFTDGLRFLPFGAKSAEETVLLDTQQIGRLQETAYGVLVWPVGAAWYTSPLVIPTDPALSHRLIEWFSRHPQRDPGHDAGRTSPGAPPWLARGWPLVWGLSGLLSAVVIHAIARGGRFWVWILVAERFAFSGLFQPWIVWCPQSWKPVNRLYEPLRVGQDALLIGSRHVGFPGILRVAFGDGFAYVVTRGDDLLVWVGSAEEALRTTLATRAPTIQLIEGLPPEADASTRFRQRALGVVLYLVVAGILALLTAHAVQMARP